MAGGATARRRKRRKRPRRHPDQAPRAPRQQDADDGEARVRRLAARFAERQMRSLIGMQALGGAGMGGFDGGQLGAPRSSWLDRGNTADGDILPQLPVLRARSRQLYNNSGEATGIVESLVSNMIGTGITPEPKLDGAALGLTPEQVKQAQADQLRVWNRWKPYADVTGELAFEDLQEQWFRNAILDGDITARRVQTKVPGAPYTTAFETIEADRIDNPLGKTFENRVCRGGVEKNRVGMPVAIWVNEEFPEREIGTTRVSGVRGMRKMRRVPIWQDGKRQVLQWYRKLRPGQSRGMPWLSPVLTDFKDHSDLRRAELFAAKILACLTVFIKRRSEGNPWAKIKDALDGEERRELKPGAIFDLFDGEEIQTVDPKRPNKDHVGFATSIIRTICAAVGMPYEVAIRDFSNSSWSNARAAVIEAKRMYRAMIASFARRILQPIWVMVMEEAWLRGELPLIREFDAHEMRAVWHPAGWEWVDPSSEGEAQKMQLEMGVTTKERLARAIGNGSYEDIVEQRSYELELEREKLSTEDGADMASAMNEYGIAVRSGSITPQKDDEAHFRGQLGLPGMSAETEAAWSEEGGVRRPVTLAAPKDNPADQPTDDEVPPPPGGVPPAVDPDQDDPDEDADEGDQDE